MLFDLDAIYYIEWCSTRIYELINLNVKFEFLLVAMYYIWWRSTRIYELINLNVKFKFLLVPMYYIWRRSTRIYEIITFKEIQDLMWQFSHSIWNQMVWIELYALVRVCILFLRLRIHKKQKQKQFKKQCKNNNHHWHLMNTHRYSRIFFHLAYSLPGWPLTWWYQLTIGLINSLGSAIFQLDGSHQVWCSKTHLQHC